MQKKENIENEIQRIYDIINKKDADQSLVSWGIRKIKKLTKELPIIS